MTDFATLLALQDLDTATDQQRHRRATLPQRTELARVEAELAEVQRRAEEIGAERVALDTEQRRLEGEAEMVGEKAAAEDARLYSGTVTAAKELQALQEEVAALGRRQQVLEDRVLELMVQAEPLDELLAALDEQRRDLATRAQALRAEVAREESSIDAEIERLVAERSAVAEQVDASLLEEYERLRTARGGIAVARLEAGACRGCHLQLSAVEVDRIRKLPATTVVHCEECGRILVR